MSRPIGREAAKIGGSLQAFNARHGRLLTRDTAFVILSDGWDTGNPEVLARELRVSKERVRQVIWLNPLLGMEDYQPSPAGWLPPYRMWMCSHLRIRSKACLHWRNI